ncbi:MAG: class I SAM-dependent methyltransferase [Candidatus Aenigmarchaeota archaeon]|nr:class I SAM-dependent methyltransferase [Candidatus Aenigmarchaeota archaeon]
MKLKIGCFDSRREGYIHLDIEKDAKPDVVGDAKALPFKENSFDEILTENVLEHIADTLQAMKEFHSVLRKKGRLKIVVPHALNPNLYSTPDHMKGFTYTTFNQFWQPQHIGYPKFNCTKRRLILANKLFQPLADRFPLKIERLFWLFSPDFIEAELEPIK